MATAIAAKRTLRCHQPQAAFPFMKLQREYPHARKRREAIDALGGPICSSCGYKEDERALQFDHINGNGIDDRKSVNGSPYNFFRKIIREGSLSYQVLCANCNAIKREVNREYGTGKESKIRQP